MSLPTKKSVERKANESTKSKRIITLSNTELSEVAGGTGTDSVRSREDDFSFVMSANKASPMLMFATALGQHIPE